MELENNKNIVIKEADKGGNKVILSTKKYCKMVYDHLNDNQIYEKTDSTCDKQNNEQNKKTIPEVWKYFKQARNRSLNKFFSFNKQFL